MTQINVCTFNAALALKQFFINKVVKRIKLLSLNNYIIKVTKNLGHFDLNNSIHLQSNIDTEHVIYQSRNKMN